MKNPVPTPGPWIAHGVYIGSPSISGGFNEFVAEVKAPTCSDAFSSLEVPDSLLRKLAIAKANAALIAAAPDLLDACRLILANLAGGYFAGVELETVDCLQKAIMKAEGRAS